MSWRACSLLLLLDRSVSLSYRQCTSLMESELLSGAVYGGQVCQRWLLPPPHHELASVLLITTILLI